MMKFLILLFLIFISCATKPLKKDPLENTKILVQKGHADLYNNGAFKIPYTKVRIIPPAPSIGQVTTELLFVDAKNSFVVALEDFKESHVLVTKGMKYSWGITKSASKTANNTYGNITDSTREMAWYLVKKGYELPVGFTAYSWELAKNSSKKIQTIGKNLKSGGKKTGRASYKIILKNAGVMSKALRDGSNKFDKSIRKNSVKHDENVSKSADIEDRKNIEASKQLSEEMITSGYKIDMSLTKSGKDIFWGSIKAAKNAEDALYEFGRKSYKTISSGGSNVDDKLQDKASRNMTDAKNSFIYGHLNIPRKISSRVSNIANYNSWEDFSYSFNSSKLRRDQLSNHFSYYFNDTLDNYGNDTKKEWKKIGDSFKNVNSTMGVTLSSIKALSYLSKYLLWDSTLKPVGKMTYGMLGYGVSEGIIFPTMVVGDGAKATVKVASKVTYETASGVIDILSPSFKAAVSSTLALTQSASGKIVKGSGYVAGGAINTGSKVVGTTTKTVTALGGSAIAGGTVGSGKLMHALSYPFAKITEGSVYVFSKVSKYSKKVYGKAVKGSGYITGKSVKAGAYLTSAVTDVVDKPVAVASKVGIQGSTNISGNVVQYIGSPLTSAGIVTGGVVSGIVAGTASAGAGVATGVVGEATAGSLYVIGQAGAATTMAVGTTASVAAGATVAAVKVAQGTTMPIGYSAGSAVVLSYGTLSQLASQGVLLVSDITYLVLSMEGPTWVVYAVQGEFYNEELPTGTIIDLGQLQKSGAKVYKVPVSKKDKDRIIKNLELELLNKSGNKN